MAGLCLIGGGAFHWSCSLVFAITAAIFSEILLGGWFSPVSVPLEAASWAIILAVFVVLKVCRQAPFPLGL